MHWNELPVQELGHPQRPSVVRRVLHEIEVVAEHRDHPALVTDARLGRIGGGPIHLPRRHREPLYSYQVGDFEPQEPPSG
jgi:hypothetical protein